MTTPVTRQRRFQAELLEDRLAPAALVLTFTLATAHRVSVSDSFLINAPGGLGVVFNHNVTAGVGVAGALSGGLVVSVP